MAAVMLAIDPGPTRSGWCILDGTHVRDSGVDDNHELLRWVQHGQHCDVLAIETMQASYAATVGEAVLGTLVWIGRYQQRWLDSGRDASSVVLISRQAVKAAVCNGNTKATDSGVRLALIERLGPPGTKRAPGPTYGVTSHAWAALAVAVAVQDARQATKTAAGAPNAVEEVQ